MKKIFIHVESDLVLDKRIKRAHKKTTIKTKSQFIRTLLDEALNAREESRTKQ